MLDKSAIREYFIQKAVCLTVPEGIKKKLEKLSVFNGDNQLDMEPFWKDFGEVIGMDIINNVNQYIKQNQHTDDPDTIVAIQTWAKNAWKVGTEKADINRIIIAYILIDRLYLIPDVDLDWNFDEAAKTKLRKYLERLPETISIEITTDFPETISYSDQKYYSDYIKALEKNDHRGIFTFLAALARGGAFHARRDYLIEITAKLSVIIDPYVFAENLCKFQPFLMWYYLMYLNPRQIADVLITYDAPDPLPLLIGIVMTVNPHGNNVFDSQLLNDNILIEKASQIVAKIAQRIDTSNIYKYITDCSNIFMNELWHCIFSAFIAKNFRYHTHYLTAIDFSYKVGEHSFKGFIANSSNVDDLDNFSRKIYDNFFHSLTGKHLNRFIHFTSYFQFLSQAIYVLSGRSHQKYLENLEQVSIELKRGIYSWKEEEWDILFTKWVLWLLSSKDFLERVEINKETLKTTYELINDIRITNALQMESESLKRLLENPGQTGSIALPVAGSYGNDKVIISWNLPNP
jgi:hypothetical protein